VSISKPIGITLVTQLILILDFLAVHKKGDKIHK